MNPQTTSLSEPVRCLTGHRTDPRRNPLADAVTTSSRVGTDGVRLRGARSEVLEKMVPVCSMYSSHVYYVCTGLPSHTCLIESCLGEGANAPAFVQAIRLSSSPLGANSSRHLYRACVDLCLLATSTLLFLLCVDII